MKTKNGDKMTKEEIDVICFLLADYQEGGTRYKIDGIDLTQLKRKLRNET